MTEGGGGPRCVANIVSLRVAFLLLQRLRRDFSRSPRCQPEFVSSGRPGVPLFRRRSAFVTSTLPATIGGWGGSCLTDYSEPSDPPIEPPNSLVHTFSRATVTPLVVLTVASQPDSRGRRARPLSSPVSVRVSIEKKFITPARF